MKLHPGDPLLSEVKRLDRQLKAEGGAFFTAWVIRRHYTRAELDRADVLHVWPKRVFEPAGEECGTTYDDTKACPACGGGAPQTGPLFLPARRIPRKADFAKTIAEEIVVSERVAEAFRAGGLSGVRLEPVRLSNQGGMPSDRHFQLVVVGRPVELHPATRVGGDLFDEDSYGRCPLGDVAGLNLLSEVTVKGETIPEADVMVTRQMVGVRRGLLRPERVLLLSRRAWRVIEDAKLKNLFVEVAHVA